MKVLPLFSLEACILQAQSSSEHRARNLFGSLYSVLKCHSSLTARCLSANLNDRLSANVVPSLKVGLFLSWMKVGAMSPTIFSSSPGTYSGSSPSLLSTSFLPNSSPSSILGANASSSTSTLGPTASSSSSSSTSTLGGTASSSSSSSSSSYSPM